MIKVVLKTILISVLLGVVIFGRGGTASASHIKATVTTSVPAIVGQPLSLEAKLHSVANNSVIANATVTFYIETTFGGVTGMAKMGSVVTDKNGMATLNYTPHVAGNFHYRMVYVAPDGEPEEYDAVLAVAGGNQQLYRSQAGIQIPGLNAWLIITIVASVWAILLSVALRVILIAHAGR